MKKVYQVNKHGRLVIEEKEDNIKSQVLEMLKEDCGFEDEKRFNNHLKKYNAYDDEDVIAKVFEVVSDIVSYDYISRDCDSYGQVSYWSKTIRKIVMLTIDDDFHYYGTLNEIIEAIKSYETEVAQVEDNMKNKKG